MAKFEQVRKRKTLVDCLKFYQASLSSGASNLNVKDNVAGAQKEDDNESKVQIRPRNPDIDMARQGRGDGSLSRMRDGSSLSQSHGNHNKQQL